MIIIFNIFLKENIFFIISPERNWVLTNADERFNENQRKTKRKSKTERQIVAK